ncbi:MAG: SurA N-terminal domain-containing protein [Verrucomicrobiaceae bacterium]|nr:SurA N-terminal domain-containing protein [Verrucomicrobiaceae bacterium]
MLEFFRRHRTTLFIVIIIVMISFTVWGGWRFDKDSRVTALPSDTAMTVFGKDYTNAEAAQTYRSIQFSMQGLQMYDLYFGLMSLGGSKASPNAEEMIGKVLALKKVMADSGIRPSDAEAVEAMKKLQSFQTNGQFDANRAQEVEQGAASMGMTSADLLDLMRLKLGLEKLKDVVAKNYAASTFAGDKSYANSQQTLKMSSITFATDDFKKGIEVKEEDIQKAFDEKKETYISEEKRAVKYVLFENLKDLDKKELPEREKLEKELSDKINKFSESVRNAGPGAKIDELAKAVGAKVETLPPFTQEAAADSIKSESSLVSAIFQHPHKTQPISDGLKGDKGWYFFSVTAVEEPKQQALAEVKDKVKESIISQRATEARTKAVNEVRDFIVAGLKDKKKIEDLVKEKKLTLVKLDDMGGSAPPPATIPEAQKYITEGGKTAEGQISKPVDTASGTVLLYVNAKELRKSDTAAASRKQQTDGLSSNEREGIFNAWFAKKLEEAAVTMPAKAETNA